MKNYYLFAWMAMATLAVSSCADEEAPGTYISAWEAATGNKIDPNQTWITAVNMTLDVTTPKGALISAYSQGKESRVLYGQKYIDGKGTLQFDIPQSSDSCIAVISFDGEEYNYKNVVLSCDAKQTAVVDFSDESTRAVAATASNHNPALDIVSRDNGKLNMGYTTFPSWTWQTIQKAVQETKNPKDFGLVYDYDLVSNGPFYITLIRSHRN